MNNGYIGSYFSGYPTSSTSTANTFGKRTFADIEQESSAKTPSPYERPSKKCDYGDRSQELTRIYSNATAGQLNANPNSNSLSHRAIQLLPQQNAVANLFLRNQNPLQNDEIIQQQNPTPLAEQENLDFVPNLDREMAQRFPLKEPTQSGGITQQQNQALSPEKFDFILGLDWGEILQRHTPKEPTQSGGMTQQQNQAPSSDEEHLDFILNLDWEQMAQLTPKESTQSGGMTQQQNQAPSPEKFDSILDLDWEEILQRLTPKEAEKEPLKLPVAHSVTQTISKSNRRCWTEERTRRLLEGIAKHGLNYQKLAEYVGAPITDIQCKTKVDNTNFHSEGFSQEILKAKKKYEESTGQPISKRNNVYWKKERARRLLEGIERYGLDYQKLADHLGSPITAIHCKNKIQNARARNTGFYQKILEAKKKYDGQFSH